MLLQVPAKTQGQAEAAGVPAIRAEKVPKAEEGRAPEVLRVIEARAARVLRAEAAALNPSELCFSFRPKNEFPMNPVALIEPTKEPARD